MKQITFDIMKYKKGYVIDTVTGYEITVNNMNYGLYQNNEETYEKENKWYIVDLNSGMAFATGATQKEVLIDANKNIQKLLDMKIEKSYKELVENFEKLKIEKDKYYYIVNSINAVDSSEQKVFEKYSDANNYKISLVFNHTNISIDKVLK